MEHCIHLAAGAVIKEVSPTSNYTLMKKIHKAFQKAEGKVVDLDALDAELGKLLDVSEDSGGDDDRDLEDSEFSFGDTIGKVLALIKQVMLCPISFAVNPLLYRFACLPKHEHSSKNAAKSLTP